MSINRVREFLPKTSTTPSINTLEGLCSGPMPLQTLVHDAVEETLLQQTLAQTVEKIRAEERQSVVKEIEAKEQKALLDYFFEIVLIGLMVEAASKKIVPSLSIKGYRARCDFRSRSFNLYFIIQSSFEDEKKFSGVLNAIEQTLLTEKNQIVEIFYSNDKKEIDYAALKIDYPFQFDLQKLKDALQPPTSSTSPAQS